MRFRSVYKYAHLDPEIVENRISILCIVFKPLSIEIAQVMENKFPAVYFEQSATIMIGNQSKEEIKIKKNDKVAYLS